MPLFTFISGFFYFYSEAKYNIKELFLKKIQSLMIPLLSFSFLFYIFFNIDINVSVVDNFCIWTKTLFHSLWFFWALLYCFIFVIFLKMMNLNNIYTFALLSFVLLFLPDYSLVFSGFKFLLPYFIAGYFMNKIKFKFETISLYVIPLYMVCLPFFHGNDLFYCSGSYINLENWQSVSCIILFRYVVGFLGCMSILKLFTYITKYKVCT